MAERSDPQRNERAPSEITRRGFWSRWASLSMVVGLVGGYGAFAAIAARYLYPARAARTQWQFVIEVARLAVGESVLFRAPSGETLNVVRRGRDGGEGDFLALSSICPHLGCQVHWEPHNARYFCPCHNGVFDEAGVGTGGPPGEAGQSLPTYPLKVESGLLFVELPVETLAGDRQAGIVRRCGPCGPGHDPCLDPEIGRRA